MTLVPESLLHGASDISLLPFKQRVWAANGSQILIAGRAIVPFKLEGRDTTVEALVAPDVEEVMLGIDFLRSHKCVWDFDSSKLYIDGRPAIAYLCFLYLNKVFLPF